MRGEVYINGLDAWNYYGVVLDEGSEEALLLPSPLKTFTSNDMRSHHGKQVFTNNPRLKDRTVSLTFCFLWAEDYMEKYARFVDMLQQGIVVLSTKIMGTKMTFNLVYNSCRKYTSIQYAGKLIVNFEEPNPANRLTGNPIDVFAPKIAALGGDSNNTIQAYKQLDPLIKNDAVTILFPTVIESGVVYGMNNISGDIVRFSFSRNSQATYFDKDINMHLAPVNMPRIDYKNYGDVANILIEKEASNFLKNSDFQNINSDARYWIVTAYVSYSYFNEIATYTLKQDSTGSSRIERTINLPKGIYTLSIEAKAKYGFAFKSFVNAVILSQHSKIIDDYSTHTAVFEVVEDGDVTIRPYFSNKYVINDEIYIKHIQIEMNNEATSYIPTGSSVSSRAADKLSYFIFGDCSVYLKTTKQNVVFDKSTGLWNIESDLNNEGIITLAIFDRILTATEKAQLTQIK